MALENTAAPSSTKAPARSGNAAARIRCSPVVEAPPPSQVRLTGTPGKDYHPSIQVPSGTPRLLIPLRVTMTSHKVSPRRVPDLTRATLSIALVGLLLALAGFATIDINLHYLNNAEPGIRAGVLVSHLGLAAAFLAACLQAYYAKGTVRIGAA